MMLLVEAALVRSLRVEPDRDPVQNPIFTPTRTERGP